MLLNFFLSWHCDVSFRDNGNFRQTMVWQALLLILLKHTLFQESKEKQIMVPSASWLQICVYECKHCSCPEHSSYYLLCQSTRQVDHILSQSPTAMTFASSQALLTEPKQSLWGSSGVTKTTCCFSLQGQLGLLAKVLLTCAISSCSTDMYSSCQGNNTM